MNPHRFLVRLLGVALGASSMAVDAAEEVRPAQPAKPVATVAPTAPAPPAPAAKSPEPAKNAPAAKPAPPPVKPPTDAELRATIAKSLVFLGKDGDKWMEERNCNSCHEMPQLVWSHREAKQRGFAIDEKKYDEWLKWTLDNAKKPAREEAALLVLALPERPAPELIKYIATTQKADGTWESGGQFTGMQKRGAPDAVANATRLSLIGLATAQPAGPELATARFKAAEMLQKKDDPTSLESLVFRTLCAWRFGTPQEVDGLRAQILKAQRGDGGWSYYLGENMSDPLATGQALYVLQPTLSDPKTADAIAKAQQWLVKTQSGDGSWPIDVNHISKVDRSSEDKAKSRRDSTMIYTFWGSAWATIGLLQAFPLKPEPVISASK